MPYIPIRVLRVTIERQARLVESEPVVTAYVSPAPREMSGPDGPLWGVQVPGVESSGIFHSDLVEAIRGAACSVLDPTKDLNRLVFLVYYQCVVMDESAQAVETRRIRVPRLVEATTISSDALRTLTARKVVVAALIQADWELSRLAPEDVASRPERTPLTQCQPSVEGS